MGDEGRSKTKKVPRIFLLFKICMESINRTIELFEYGNVSTFSLQTRLRQTPLIASSPKCTFFSIKANPIQLTFAFLQIFNCYKCFNSIDAVQWLFIHDLTAFRFQLNISIRNVIAHQR